ncbi:MAG: hypothetical protein KTR19_02725 [Hyphomicrobiales bacterium]|nr:hypothetical protein [Hyphomicrobiales bacterium]
MSDDDKRILRARDFWGSIVLILTSVFFLIETRTIPLFEGSSAGVSGIQWYDSAAIVPLCIFTSLLLLGCLLLGISIRAGGAEQALSAVGLGWDRFEAIRFSTIMVCLSAYIFGLVPRVDFIIASALLLSCLIWGYTSGSTKRMGLVAAIMALAATQALAFNASQALWSRYNDDYFTLAVWGALVIFMLATDGARRMTRAVPVISVIVPLFLIMAMAFGFRQNVPARTGLLFKQIEYHWFVTLKPLWNS